MRRFLAALPALWHVLRESVRRDVDSWLPAAPVVAPPRFEAGGPIIVSGDRRVPSSWPPAEAGISSEEAARRLREFALKMRDGARH